MKKPGSIAGISATRAIYIKILEVGVSKILASFLDLPKEDTPRKSIDPMNEISKRDVKITSNR